MISPINSHSTAMIHKIFPTDFDTSEIEKILVDPATQQDDFFDYSKIVVKKPWGYEYLIYQNNNVAVWILYLKPGFQTSMHCHPHKKTSLVVLSGKALCSHLSGETILNPGDGLLIEKGVFHRTRSLSEEGIFVMEIEAPINKRDLVRLKDEYGRVGKGYESVDQMSFNIQNYNYISFIEQNVYYNVKKKFGSCSISLATFQNFEDFQHNFHLEGWDAVSILKGKMLDDVKNNILDVGDTIDLDLLRTHKNIHIEEELEIMVIKKRDRMAKFSDYVISLLEREKIKNIFLVPGSANVHLLDSVGRNTNMTHITTQTEQAATQAAESYAKATGNIGAVILSSGGSSTNALTGVADAWIDSTPLLIISGQSQSDQTIKEDSALRQLGIQEVDIINMVRPITKYAVKIQEPTNIRYHLEKAIHLAREGRAGPVWIDIPINFQGMSLDEEELLGFNPENDEESALPIITKPAVITPQVINTVYGLLSKSERPVFLAGNGIRLSGAEEEFHKVIEFLGLPVLTSKRGADLLPENHPLFFGRPGAYGQRSANFILQNADLLLSVGSRLSLPLLGRNYKAFARGAKKIIVDIDSDELKKPTVTPDLAIACSAKQFLQALLETTLSKTNSECRPRPIAAWLERCRVWKQKYAYEPLTTGLRINPYQFVDLLSDTLPPGAILSVDGGSPNIFLMQRFRFKSGQRLLSATGLENISFGLSGAIGASIAHPGKTIICLCEDRGFQKNISELETIVQYNLPIKIFILNTQGYSYIKKTQKEYFGGRLVASTKEKGSNASAFSDIITLGKAYGLPGFRIDQPLDIAEGIQRALDSKGAVITEIVIDEEQEIVPRITFNVRPEGKWIAKPLEDMYPFQNRKEFKENMIIEPLEEEEP